MRRVLVDAEPESIAIDPRRDGARHHRHAARLPRARRLRRVARQRRRRCLHAAVEPVARSSTRRAASACWSCTRARAIAPISPTRRARRSSAARHRCASARPARWGASWFAASRGTTSSPRWRRSQGEPVVDKPGKGAFFATDLHELLRNRGIDTLLVCGVTTEVCVHTTVREANDRGYRCIVPGDCCASYFPEFHAAGLAMIKAQGGIFGWVSDSRRVLAALSGAAPPRPVLARETTT